MSIYQNIVQILAEILDLPAQEITPTTYLIRELHAESIDLLEIGVAMEHGLGIVVDDDRLFLKNLRLVLSKASPEQQSALDLLAAEYTHLSPTRLEEILQDLPHGPALQVQDLVDYAQAAHKTQS